MMPDQAKGRARREKWERLLEALRAGNSIATAARFAGLSPKLVHRCLARGRQMRSGPAHRLRRDVELARAMAEIRAVGLVMKAMEKDWRAAIAFLERRLPRQWSNRQHRPGARPAPPTGSGPRQYLEEDHVQTLQELIEAHCRASGLAEASGPPAP